MFTSFSSGHKLALSLVTFVAVISGVTYALISGVAAILVTVAFVVVLWMARPLLLPAGYGANRVRLLSLSLAAALVATHSLWATLIEAGVKVLAKQPELLRWFPGLKDIEVGQTPSLLVLGFFLLVVWIVNVKSDNSLAGSHPVALNKEFSEDRFEQKLKSFCSALRQHLETTDREANWSPDYYADLEAEVEVVSNAGMPGKKRVVDLQDALRGHQKTQSFLLLGDPGGGKSVALRKLAKVMLDEVGLTHRIPIYIDLRQWLPNRNGQSKAWTEESPPSKQDLLGFVMSSLKARGDIFTEEFVEIYFKDLWQKGHLFFIFDSFDEMPELLDETEESWLIDELSKLLSSFVCTDPRSRGVLASRVFRRPTSGYLAQKVLEIRPLSEDRMVQAFERFRALNKGLQSQLFRERTDLVPLARNPFLLTLLGEWVTEHRSLPRTQAQLYESYLRSRLEKVKIKIAQSDLSQDEILESATSLAWFIFSSPEYGLEAPVKVLDRAPNVPNAAAVIEVLRHARIARVTSGDQPSFAFVHRRFLEYMVTTRFLENPAGLPITDIPTDSRGRDVMVLYAQLCDEVEALRLANLCWKEVLVNFRNPDNRLRAIHSLRYLIEAFRSRRGVLAPIEDNLAKIILFNVTGRSDMILAKICLECTGLLSDKFAVPILKEAMIGGNSWLQETALRACRNLPKVGDTLQEPIIEYLQGMPVVDFWKNYSALRFSLSLSEGFDRVLTAVRLRRAKDLTALLAFFLCMGVAPFIFIFSLFCAFVYRVFDSGVDLFGRKMRESGGRTTALSGTERGPSLWSRSLGLDWVRLAKLSMVSPLLGVSLVSIAHGDSKLKELDLSYQFLIFPISYVLSPMQTGYVLLVIFLMLFWMPIWKVFTGLVYVLRIQKFNMVYGLIGRYWHLLSKNFVVLFRVFLGVTIFSACIFYGVTWLNEKYGLQVVSMLMSVLSVLAGLWFLVFFLLGVRIHWVDQRTIRVAVISSKISREEIAATLGSLVTVAGRMRYVRLLAESKVAVIGEWPASFALSVEADAALVELARLEERWLKLDR